MPMWRMILLDQQKGIRAHARPPALHGVAIGTYCFLYFFAIGRVALRADDDFLEHERRFNPDPVEPLRVRRVIKVHEHPHLLFVAPALVLGARQAVREVEVHVLRAMDLQEIRLIEDVGVVVGAGIALRDIEAETDASMGGTIVTPEQQVVPIPAEAQDGCRLPEKRTEGVCRLETDGLLVSSGQRSNGSFRSLIVDSLSRLF
jgi:hypothetical protein